MEIELKEYTLAFNAHLKAQQDEMKIKQEVKSTYYRLMRAKDEMRAKERELLSDIEITH